MLNRSKLQKLISRQADKYIQDKQDRIDLVAKEEQELQEFRADTEDNIKLNGFIAIAY